MLKQIKQKASTKDDAREINFAIRSVAKQTLGAKEKYRLPDSLKRKLDILRRLLRDDTIPLEMPFANIVPRD